MSNKFKMDKKTELGSSIYFSDKAFSINSQTRSRIQPAKRHHYKVEIVNQNLEDAIREVKSNIRQNPQWHLNVQSVAQQYQPKKEHPQPINESIQEHPGANSLPLSKREPQDFSLSPSRRPDLERLKYTDRLKREYDERIRKIKEKRMLLEVESLQKQMKAKLQRKVKQNIALRQKAKLIKEIQERREEKMKLLDKQHLKTKEEKSLLHQSSVAKVDMIRRYKNRAKKKEISETVSQCEISKQQLVFKQLLNEKQKMERKEVLLTRYRMLRTASQGSVRQQRAINARQIRSSQSTKGLGEAVIVH